MIFLVRHEEVGREAQGGRRQTQRDVVAAVRAGLPDAAIETGVGRVVVETGDPRAGEVLSRVHGITSLSPARRCRLGELEDVAVAVARGALPAGGAFRVRVRRQGEHGFTSTDAAAALGAAIVRAVPGARVELDDPDLAVGVEIRGETCYVFDRAIPGVDHRAAAAGAADAGPAGTDAGEPALLVDKMLGTLVSWLRLAGLDAVYAGDGPDSLHLRRARAEGRVLVTRDRALARSPGARAILVTADDPVDQLAEILDELDIELDEDRMFTRCTLCNRPVEPVDKRAVADRLPPAVAREHDQFTRCPSCDKIYWRGRQYRRALERGP